MVQGVQECEGARALVKSAKMQIVKEWMGARHM